MVENPGLAVGFWRYLLLFQWCNYFRFWRPYRYFWLSFDVIVTCWFVRAGQKPQVWRRNCSDICHTVEDTSTSALDSHALLFLVVRQCRILSDTFFEFGVVENFVYRARITVILTSDLFSCMSLWLWLCAVYDDLLLLPVLSVILKMYIYCSLYLVFIPSSLCLVILPFSVSNIQKCHICEIYIFASQAYNADSRKTSLVDVRSKPDT